jgi:microcin C transport system substrate-binding protein
MGFIINYHLRLKGLLLAIFSLWCVTSPQALAQQQEQPQTSRAHAYSIWGDIQYPKDFTHFDYIDPKAPKGGTLTLMAKGTFDSLHPFVANGTVALGISDVGEILVVYETLMVRSRDEPSTAYGLIAESLEVAADKSSLIVNLRQQARFHDGKDITADDVVFSFNVLKEQGHPGYRQYFAKIIRAEKLSAYRVKFLFSEANNRALPMLIGDLPVLPAHYWKDRDFSVSSLEPPLGSGPYRVGAVDQGRSIRYERVADYWAKDLPINRGQYNFDTLHYIYFRDNTVAFAAFKSQDFDLYTEYDSNHWKNSYSFPAVLDGRVKKFKLPDLNPRGMQGFALNTRREKFKDPRVRQALSYAWDFEWSNNTFANGDLVRTNSYFENSEQASRGVPMGKEFALLEPYREQLPSALFTQSFKPLDTDGSGYIRDNLRKALTLLNEAGWHLHGDRLLNTDGKQFSIEFLNFDQRLEGIIAALIKNLEKLGITGSIRLVDATQFISRRRSYDFDSILHTWQQTPSPGGDQRFYWGSEAGKQEGSLNYAGIDSPVVDGLIEAMVQAQDRETLAAATRALDRVLLWGFYVIPQWYLPYHRVAAWDNVSNPSLVGTYHQYPSRHRAVQTWWSKDLGTKSQRSQPSTGGTQ